MIANRYHECREYTNKCECHPNITLDDMIAIFDFVLILRRRFFSHDLYTGGLFDSLQTSGLLLNQTKQDLPHAYLVKVIIRNN